MAGSNRWRSVVDPPALLDRFCRSRKAAMVKTKASRPMLHSQD
jgi:hypothetical protein